MDVKPPRDARKDLDKLRSRKLSDAEMRTELWKKGYTQAQISGLVPEAPPKPEKTKDAGKKHDAKPPRVNKKRLKTALFTSAAVLVGSAVGCAIYGLPAHIFMIGAGMALVLFLMLGYGAMFGGGMPTTIVISGDSLVYEVPPAERRRRARRALVPMGLLWLAFVIMVGGASPSSIVSACFIGLIPLIPVAMVFALPALKDDPLVKLMFSGSSLGYEKGKKSGSIALGDIGGLKTSENSPNVVFPDLVYRGLWVMGSGEKISMLRWKGRKLLKLGFFCTPEDFEQIISFISGQMAKRGMPLHETLSRTLRYETGSTRIRILSAEA